VLYNYGVLPKLSIEMVATLYTPMNPVGYDGERHMKAHGKIQNESGMALLTSLLMLIILTGIAVTGYNASDISQKASASAVSAKQAFQLADAGLQHGKALLYLNTATMKNYASATPTSLIATTQLSPVGSYSVTVQAAGTAGLRLFSTGISADGSSVASQSLVPLPTPPPTGTSAPGYAIVTGKSLLISGAATVAGTYGAVHANGDLTIDGDPTINSDATASGTYTVTGNPVIGGISGGGTPVQAVSLDVKAANYYNARDYYLTSKGDVTILQYVTTTETKKVKGVDTTTTTTTLEEVVQTMVGGKWNCWSHSKTFKRWTMDCDKPLNGTYYVEGDVLISGSAGTTAAPWIATIVAEGSIEVSSTSLNMRPPQNTAAESTLFKSLSQNMLLIADGDVLIDGFSGQTFTGVIAAREQVGITGDPAITGFIYAQDAALNNKSVLSSYISGKLNLTYNGQYGDLGKI
jgi:hypothetical protein